MINTQIKSARKAKGLSRKQLAEAVQMSEIAIRKIEEGQRPHIVNLEKIANVLGLKVEINLVKI